MACTVQWTYYKWKSVPLYAAMAADKRCEVIRTDRKIKAIHRIREFNRFYTVLTGLLDRNFLDSGYSVTETRILFELKSREDCSANELVESLHIDKSYLSRILKGFEGKGLLARHASRKDARSLELRLTETGENVTERLIDASDEQISRLLKPLSEAECLELCEAMDRITGYLTKSREEN